MATPENKGSHKTQSQRDLEEAVTKWAYSFTGTEPPRPPRQTNLIAELCNKDGWSYYINQTSFREVALAAAAAAVIAGGVGYRIWTSGAIEYTLRRI